MKLGKMQSDFEGNKNLFWKHMKRSKEGAGTQFSGARAPCSNMGLQMFWENILRFVTGGHRQTNMQRLSRTE